MTYTISQREREDITSIISDVLRGDERVVFAYLYGSFITGSFFNDIDIFLFTRNAEDPFTCSASIKEELSHAVTKAGFDIFAVDDFDVRIINDAPYDFAIDLLCEGILIVDKNSDRRTDYIEKISNEYRVNYFVLDEAFHAGR
jgi:predicted nucleotidyltransferase